MKQNPETFPFSHGYSLTSSPPHNQTSQELPTLTSTIPLPHALCIMVLLYHLYIYKLSLPPFSMSNPSQYPLITFLTFSQIQISLHLCFHPTPIIIFCLETCKSLLTEPSGFNYNPIHLTHLLYYLLGSFKNPNLVIST